MSKKGEEKWNPNTGFFSHQYLATGIPTLEERMNWLAMRQKREGKKFGKHDTKDHDEFASAEERVVSCTHDWQPVHKWLHKEYLHCPKCGALKHEDGTVWFFVGHHPFRLIIKRA
jgi:hypothetical protein